MFTSKGGGVGWKGTDNSLPGTQKEKGKGKKRRNCGKKKGGRGFCRFSRLSFSPRHTVAGSRELLFLETNKQRE